MAPVVIAGEVSLPVVSSVGGNQESVCRSYGETETKGVRGKRELDSLFSGGWGFSFTWDPFPPQWRFEATGLGAPGG